MQLTIAVGNYFQVFLSYFAILNSHLSLALMRAFGRSHEFWTPRELGLEFFNCSEILQMYHQYYYQAACQISQRYKRFIYSLAPSRFHDTLTLASVCLIVRDPVLPMCLSNFKAIRQFKVPISWLRDFTRSYEKTSFRILRRGPGTCFVVRFPADHNGFGKIFTTFAADTGARYTNQHGRVSAHGREVITTWQLQWRRFTASGTAVPYC